MNDGNPNGRGNGAPANDNSDDDDEFDQDERAAIQAAVPGVMQRHRQIDNQRRQLQLAAQQPVPRQLPPPVQAPLLNRMAESIQKKDKEKLEEEDDDKEEDE